jgi:exopolysaccharide biosynthesis protein
MRWLILGLLGWRLLGAVHEIAPGISVEEREFRRYDQGPFRLWILRLDPKRPNVNVLPLHAEERAMGVQTTDAMAKRYGALAAVNGGYFAFGNYLGISKNNFVANGRVLGTWVDRSGLIFCEEQKGVERLAVAMTKYDGSVSVGKEKWHLDGVNRERSSGELIWYTSDLGKSTRTREGVEVVLDRGRNVVSVTRSGDAAIPLDGSVLSGEERAGNWLMRVAAPGRKVQVEAKVNQDACPARDVVSAGPRIVRQGQLDLSEKGFAHALVRHPRTAAGVGKNGEILFVVVDGRQHASVGMTLEELGQTMIELGAWEAVNLDGGGSSTFFAQDRIWNRPSDGRTRPVSDAILVFSIASSEELRQQIRRLAETEGILSSALARRLQELAAKAQWKAMLGELDRGQASEFTKRILREAIEAMEYNRPHGVLTRP